jgi:hypothetical protein
LELFIEGVLPNRDASAILAIERYWARSRSAG